MVSGSGNKQNNGFDYVTHGPVSGAPKKLVFAFHGYGRDASLMQKPAEEIVKAMPDAMVIMPNGPEEALIPRDDKGNIAATVPHAVRNNEKYKKLYKFEERQWFPVHGDINQRIKESDKVAKKLNDFIDAKRDMLGLTDKDIAIVGFSQGGFMALRTAFNRASEVGCAVGHSCIFVEGPDMKSKPKTLFVYGTADEDITQVRFKDSVKALRKFGVDTETKKVQGLTHKTSDQSRKIMARYIKKYLSP